MCVFRWRDRLKHIIVQCNDIILWVCLHTPDLILGTKPRTSTRVCNVCAFFLNNDDNQDYYVLLYKLDTLTCTCILHMCMCVRGRRAQRLERVYVCAHVCAHACVYVYVRVMLRTRDFAVINNVYRTMRASDDRRSTMLLPTGI